MPRSRALGCWRWRHARRRSRFAAAARLLAVRRQCGAGDRERRGAEQPPPREHSAGFAQSAGKAGKIMVRHEIERPPEEARGTDRNKVAVPRCRDALYQRVMAAEIRLDSEGVAEPGRRAEADGPAMLALSGGRHAPIAVIVSAQHLRL